MEKVVVITGDSFGIGLETSLRFIKEGYKVYGLSRREFSLEGMEHFVCDVTDEYACKEAIGKIIEKSGSIDVLVNNAGYGIAGAVEMTEIADAKKIFDVNFFGAFNMIKACAPYLRKSKGRIVNVSSVAGKLIIPFQAFYSATKAALDALSSALRAELKPFGVSVTSVLPGDTKTGFTASRTKSENGVYEERFLKSISVMEKDEQNGVSPKFVADVIFKVASARRAPIFRTVGFNYKLIVFLAKILPARTVEWIVSKIYG